jgi:hypothetical protein
MKLEYIIFFSLQYDRYDVDIYGVDVFVNWFSWFYHELQRISKKSSRQDPPVTYFRKPHPRGHGGREVRDKPADISADRTDGNGHHDEQSVPNIPATRRRYPELLRFRLKSSDFRYSGPDSSRSVPNKRRYDSTSTESRAHIRSGVNTVIFSLKKKHFPRSMNIGRVIVHAGTFIAREYR